MGILLADSETKTILEANQKYKEILGRPNEDIVGKEWSDFTHQDDLLKDISSSQKLAQGDIYGFKSIKRYVRPNGDIIWAEVLVVKLNFSKGRSKNLVMASDITDRVRLEEDLRKSLVLKDEFIEIAAHELKTPTSALKMQLQWMLRKMSKGTYNSETFSKDIQNSILHVDRLVDLIGRLLEVSEITSKSMRLKKVEINLTDVLNEVIQILRPEFQKAHCEVRRSQFEDIIGVFDIKKITQVISGIIENACKYAPGGPIDIELKQSLDEVKIIIRDHGPGLSQESLSKIFNRFERLEHDRSVSGFGVGLYLAKKNCRSSRWKD